MKMILPLAEVSLKYGICLLLFFSKSHLSRKEAAMPQAFAIIWRLLLHGGK
jgi:hypothetical protein